MRQSSRVGLTALFSVLAFALAALLVMPAGCADVGGVPSWERCTTLLGTPAFSLEDLGLDTAFDILVPLLAAALAGVVSWFAFGRFTEDG